MKLNKKLLFVFLGFFVIRLVFSISAGFTENYKGQSDSIWLIDFAKKAIQGDFNFYLGRFIASPLYPLFAALHMIIFGDYWNIALVFSQIIISSLSGVFLYKLTERLFNITTISAIATVLYALFPMTLWYVHTFAQETLFQSLYIISVYYLVAAYQNDSLKNLILSSILFSLAYLTKSHVLLFALFIPLILFIYNRDFKKTILYTVIYAGICIAFSAPYGLYNKYKNGVYVLSSNGSSYQFYLGNTEAGYITVVNVPDKDSEDYVKMKNINNTAGYFNGSQHRYDSLITLPQSEKQKAFFADGLHWIKNNPYKFIKMKVYDIALFVMPGVSFRHYPFKEWLLSFLISFPLYLFAYIGIIMALKNNFKEHVYMVSIFFTMLLFSTVWYVQNRFRTITIEPFYIIYASYAIYTLFIKYIPAFLKRNVNNI